MSGISSTFDRLHAQLMRSLLRCRGHARTEQVHLLRTDTRRLEALLHKLLEDNPGAAQLERKAARLLRRLKQVRSLAAPVRDLDVHRTLAAEIARRTPAPITTAEREQLLLDFARLDRRLLQRRKRAVAKLRAGLAKHGPQLKRAFAETAEELVPLKSSRPTPLATAQSWVRRSVVELAPLREANLHDLRKRTKAARYLAELNASAPAQRWVKRLKAVQDAIGRWHDLDLLAEEASSLLGGDAPLTHAIAAERDCALTVAVHTAAGLDADSPNTSAAKKPATPAPASQPRPAVTPRSIHRRKGPVRIGGATHEQNLIALWRNRSAIA